PQPLYGVHVAGYSCRLLVPAQVGTSLRTGDAPAQSSRAPAGTKQDAHRQMNRGAADWRRLPCSSDPVWPMLAAHFSGTAEVCETAMKALLLALIRAYQYLLSPWVGNQCRFYPTCSAYAA